MEQQQAVPELNQETNNENQDESLQQIPLKTLAENVIKDYEKLLYDAMVINGSLKDIQDKKSRPSKRTSHWIFFIIYMGILIPRFSLIGFLYMKDEKTRLFWQYYLVDYYKRSVIEE